MDGAIDGVDAATDGNPTGDGGVETPDASLGLTGWVALGAPLPTTASFLSPAMTTDGAGMPLVAFLTGTDAASYGVEVYRVVGGAWTQVGARIPMGIATVPDVAASGTEIHVAWPQGDRRHLRTWNGTSWSTPAGSPVGTYDTFLPHVSLAVDAGGRPWIAYNEHSASSSSQRVFVNAHDGGAFPPRGFTGYANALYDPASPNQSALAPDLAAGGGAMFVAWEGNGVHVRRWDAGSASWTATGAGKVEPPAGAGVTSASTSAIAVDGAGRPTVVYHAYKGGADGTNVFVARHDGTSWVHLGQNVQAYAGMASGSATYATAQDVAVTVAGDVFIAFTEEDAAGHAAVHVWRCATSGCAPVGRGRLDADAGEASTAKMAIDHAGRPIVAWAEATASGAYRLHVWRYFGDPDAP